MFDTQTWGFDRQAKFTEREGELIARAAAAPEAKRRAARLDLARFYLAREMAAEAKGVLDVVTADERRKRGRDRHRPQVDRQCDARPCR